jgi:hypothetical protein
MQACRQVEAGQGEEDWQGRVRQAHKHGEAGAKAGQCRHSGRHRQNVAGKQAGRSRPGGRAWQVRAGMVWHAGSARQARRAMQGEAGREVG